MTRAALLVRLFGGVRTPLKRGEAAASFIMRVQTDAGPHPIAGVALWPRSCACNKARVTAPHAPHLAAVRRTALDSTPLPPLLEYIPKSMF